MKNKNGIVEKEEAERAVAEREARKAIEARRKEVINRINSLMESAGLVRVSKDGKRKFYQAAFEKAFGINKSTASFYYQLKRDIPIETLLQIRNHEMINCSLDYLLLESDAEKYEFDTVIKKTGLSEKATGILLHNNTMANQTMKHLGEVSISELYIDAVNYLITNGDLFLHTFAKAMTATEHLRESERQHIAPFAIPDQVIAYATMTYNDGYDKDGKRYTEASFVEDMNQCTFNMKESDQLRPLTKEELHHLFEHVKVIRTYNPAVWKNECRDQLEGIFSAISSES